VHHPDANAELNLVDMDAFYIFLISYKLWYEIFQALYQRAVLNFWDLLEHRLIGFPRPLHLKHHIVFVVNYLPF